MDGVDDAILVVEPHFVAPFLGLAVCVFCGVVVDHVAVSDVGVEG